MSSFESSRSWRPEDAGRPPVGPVWRREEMPLVERKRRTYFRKVALVVVFFAVCCAVLIWLSMWLRPAKDTDIILIGAGYEQNLAVPHNVYGWKSLTKLAQLAKHSAQSSIWESGRLRLVGEPRLFIDAANWDRDLLKIKGRNVIVYFSAHGGADANGAYLLTQNVLQSQSDGANKQNFKLRISNVLRRLKKFAGREKNIVLVLDVPRMTQNWRLGMLNNGFAHELRKLNDTIADIPNLTVMCSSDEGEKTWDSAIIGQSVFSFYFQEALSGAAETEPADGRISLLELYQYLTRKVGQWALNNRDATQTPILLPAGKVGQNRADRTFLTAVKEYRPTEISLQPFSPPASLIEAWKNYVQLATHEPPPAAYTPHTWRLYQELLLRYEQLVRAGDDDNALAVRLRLRDLEQSMSRVREVQLSSDTNTLTMYAAQGIQPSRRHAFHPWLNQLWETPKSKLAKTWDTLRKKAESDPQVAKDLDGLPFRLKMMDLVLHRAAEEPAQYVGRVSDLLSVMKDPFLPQPAEAHYTTMFGRDLLQRQKAGDPIPSNFLRQVFQLRLKAEQAALAATNRVQDDSQSDATGYTYSEDVSPWIAKLIHSADDARRKGQDLLFTTQTDRWEKAGELLATADKLYDEAFQQALLVQKALRLRDQVYSLIPFYGNWLAKRQAVDDRLAKDDPISLLKKFEIVCDKAHRLFELLDAPSMQKDLDNSLTELGKLTSELQRTYVDWHKWAFSYRNNLESVALASMWRKIDDSLSVPFYDAEMRKKLLVDRSSVGRSLWRKFLGETGAGTDSQRPTDDQIIERIRRRGRVALAILGKNWYNEAGAEKIDQTLNRLSTMAEQWRNSSLIAGEQIALRWKRMTRQIDEPFKKRRIGDPPPQWSSLLKAERLSRFIDATGVLAMTHNPAGLARQTRLQKLLLSQTQRVFDDHWFAENPSDHPYYAAAGKRYLSDVQRFAKSPFSVSGETVAKMDSLLKSPNDLAIELTGAPGLPDNSATAPVLHFTTERAFPLAYRLTVPKDSNEPFGYPVFWVETGTKLQLETNSMSPVGKANTRFDRLVKPGEQLSFNFVLRSDWLNEMQRKPPQLAVATESSFQLHANYRGRPLSVTTRIDLHPLAQTTLVSHPVPKRGSVAVRASKAVHNQFGAGSGSIVIVLDASGSMRPQPGQPFGEDTKFVEATSALRTVLAKIPSGTSVSLWVFGQAMGPEKTVNDVERTITPIMPPTIWNADPKQVDQWMKKVEYPAVEPWNESPIMRAMLTAAQQDFANASGFKTMVVITDGMDNRFANDKQANPQGKSIGEVLRQYFGDVSVNVIGFKLVGKEAAKARQQFDAITKLPIPGKFYTVRESGELIQALEDSFQRKLTYYVDREDNQPVPSVPISGLEISGEDGVDQWLPGGLPPGGYKLRVHANKRLTKSFALNWSDLLLVELAQDKREGAPLGALEFQRVIYSLANFPFKPAKFNDEQTWRFAVLQNQRTNGGAEMLMTLERAGDPNVDVLQQIHPFKTWIEVKQPDGATGFSQRWHYQPGYPAPTWSLEMPFWPSQGGASSRPKVSAWWNPDQPPSTAAEFEKGHDYQNLTDLSNRTKNIGTSQIVLESVTIEKHLVEIKPARIDKPAIREMRDCLVVRMQHEPDHPIWARVAGVNPAGAEHRWYRQAGKYTAIFWPVTSDQAASFLNKIEVVSLPMFKQEAQRRKFSVTLDNIYEPQASDTRPLPPVDLWKISAEQMETLPRPNSLMNARERIEFLPVFRRNK